MNNLTPEQIEALNGSIAHWERMASGNRISHEEVGPSSCDCCQKWYSFAFRSDAICCVGCPIYDYTGLKCCEGTPWEAIEKMWDDNGGDLDYDSPEFKAVAARELEFLKSLLP